MDWDLGFFPEPLNKSLNAFAFNQLLDNLRAVYEEACLRNAVLERELTRKGTHGIYEIKKDDPWSPTNFLATPRDEAPPRRPPQSTGTLANTFTSVFTPRSRAIDILARQQEYLTQSIHQLAEEQRFLHEEVTEALLSMTKKAAPAAPGGNRGSSGHATRRTDLIDQTPSAGAASGTASSHAKPRKTAKKSIFGAAGAALGRFAVATGEKRSIKRTWTEDESDVHPLRRLFRQILHSYAFNAVSGAIIFAYALTIAIETNLLSQDPDFRSPTFVKLHLTFTGLFLAELLLRVAADGLHCFCGEDAAWNRLDAFFILSATTELIVEKAAGHDKAGSASAIARGVRIFRVFRTVRLVRTFKQFFEFQKMAYALLSSFKTLLCSLALLCFVMFFFAVWFTQSAANEQKRIEIPDLDLRYGDLLSTTYTLFLSISNGIGWDVCYMPLYELSFWSAQGFIVYIAVVYFGVLNVVTSVFVESVIRKLEHYKDIIVKDKEVENRIAMNHVKAVFKKVDDDGSGCVTLDEMEYFLAEPALNKYMEALDLEVSDTRVLFELLDFDGSGSVSIDEFCEGCLRLKGAAKSIDMAALTYQVKSFLVKWGEFTKYVDHSLSDIRKVCAKR